MNVIKVSFEWNGIIAERSITCLPYEGSSVPTDMFQGKEAVGLSSPGGSGIQGTARFSGFRLKSSVVGDKA